MRHLKSGRKLKRTNSHKKALMRNMATSLFEFKKIHTTEIKAKELRPYAEKLITKAKDALAREKQGLLPDGQTIDIHNRRVVARHIQSKAVLQELFDTIAPLVEERPGGYTRIVKTGFRRGDGGSTALIELVDWSNPQDGPTSIKKKKKTKTKKSKPVAKTAKPEKEAAAPAVEEAPTAEIVEEAITQEETIEVKAEVKAEETTEEIAAEVATEEVAAEVEEVTEVEAKTDDIEAKAEEAADEEVKDESSEDKPEEDKK